MEDNKIILGNSNIKSEQPVIYDYNLNLDGDVYVEIKYDKEGKHIVENIELQAKSIDLSYFKNNK